MDDSSVTERTPTSSAATADHMPSTSIPLGGAADRLVVFVTGRAQSGKTTVAREFARRLGSTGEQAEVTETSAIIADRLERKLSLTPGSYQAARAADPDAHRGELGAFGERMARRNGWSAARIAVARGARVISGTRRLTELRAAVDEARRRGLEPWVVWVERPGKGTVDNTDSLIRLLAMRQGTVLVNDRDESSLRRAAASALASRCRGRDEPDQPAVFATATKRGRGSK